MIFKTKVEIVPKKSMIEGELIIKSLDKQGNTFIYKTPNVIVYDAKATMAYLLSGDSSALLSLGYLGVGENNTAPTRADTALLSSVTQVAFTAHTYPAAGQVEYTAILDFVSPANGYILREAGLFSNNGTTMFSRQVYGDIEKTASSQLQYIWRIIFT